MKKLTLLAVVAIVLSASPAWARKPRGHAIRAVSLPLVAPPLPPLVVIPPPPAPAVINAAASIAPKVLPMPVVPAMVAAPPETHAQTVNISFSQPSYAVQAPPPSQELDLDVPAYDASADATTNRWVFGLKAGGMLGTGNAFGSSPTLTLEGGYILPGLQNHLQLYGNVGYASTQRGLNVQGIGQLGNASASLTANQVWLSAGLLARLFPLENRFNIYAYGGVACIASVMKSSTQSGGNTVGSASDTAMNVGGQGGVGLEIALGPGNIMFESGVVYAPGNNSLSGPMNAGGFTAQGGYRFLF